jgi:hypothetical protein
MVLMPQALPAVILPALIVTTRTPVTELAHAWITLLQLLLLAEIHQIPPVPIRTAVTGLVRVW